MIKIVSKYDCCGCSACVQVCPKQCISFDEDERGFRYPNVDETLCVDCGLCNKVCPIINNNEPLKPLQAYAGINISDEIRQKSSSGGIFSLMAESIINEGGVVFGARFDENWEVKHDYTESIEGIAAFRGSKYVQSKIGDTFRKAKDFLVQGRKVLFSGTPCQIAGLKRYLHKDYCNLFTVDVVCHGVPSPLVWREYLKTITLSYANVPILSELPEITGISFRDKRYGWKNYGFSISGKIRNKINEPAVSHFHKEKYLFWESKQKNVYLQLFLKDFCLRPSCYKCSFKNGRSHSDVTIADYWGVGAYLPEMDDKKGTSLILLQTNKGKDLISQLNMKKVIVNYKGAVNGNVAYFMSPYERKEIEDFWQQFYQSGFSNMDSFVAKFRLPFYKLLYISIKRFIYSLIPSVIFNKYRQKKISKNYN